MDDAAAGFAAHRTGADAWALGRFVVPLSRVDELAEARRAFRDDVTAWPTSVVTDTQTLRGVDLSHVRQRHRSLLDLGAVEIRVASHDEAAAVATVAGSGFETFVEAEPGSDIDSVLEGTRSAGAAAKIRTGGVTASAFPSDDRVLQFMRSCHRMGLRFKATAGLHHPLRGEYPLTYEPGAERGTMHGYLNIFLAAALVRQGAPDDVVLAALRERDGESLIQEPGGLSWRDWRLEMPFIDDLRDGFVAGFGSCSFREPLDELSEALRVAA